jgi:hypothetical protein
MIRNPPKDISVSDFIAFADAVEAFNRTLSGGKRLSVYYIPIRPGSKSPATSKAMYKLDANGNEIPSPKFVMSREKALRYLEGGHGNIGILAYDDGVNPSLALIDFDITKNPDDGVGKTVIPKEMIAEFTRANELPITITRQGGYHVYVVNDGSFKNANIIYHGQHAGEVRCHKMYVVAPGSFVPPNTEDDAKKGKIPTPEATGTYRLLTHRPIKYFAKDSLPDWMSLDTESTPERARRSRKVVITPIDRPITGGDKYVNDIGIDLTTIRARDADLDKALMHGAIESDRSKADYKVAWKLRNWGFDDSNAAGILREYRPSDKTQRDDYVEMTLSKVIRDYEYRPYIELKNGYERLQANAKKMEAHATLQIEARIDGTDKSGLAAGSMTEDGVLTLAEFPTLLPGEKYIHLRGLPRIGKSHWTLSQLAGEASGVYVTSNHDIIEQQFRTFRHLAPDRTAVWLKGKSRCCVRGNDDGMKYRCEDCKYRPTSEFAEDDGLNRPTIDQVQTAVDAIIERDGYLCYTADSLSKESQDENDIIKTNVPGWICPYFALHAGAKSAEFIFTVPYYTAAENDLTTIRETDLMVMDEDTVFKFYAPKTVSLLEYGHSGAVTNFRVQSNIAPITSTFARVKSAIEAKDRQTAEDKTVMAIIRVYEEIEKVIARVAQGEQEPKHPPEVRVWITDKIHEIVGTQFDDLSTGGRMGVLRALEEYQRTLGGISEDGGIVEYSEAVLFPYRANPLHWEHDSPATLYLVADEGTIIRTPTPAKKYLIVGFTEGEMFAEQMSRRDFGDEWNANIAKLHVKRFPYGKNFVVFKVTDEKKKREQRLLTTLAREMDVRELESEWKATRLTLTASKKHQSSVNERSSSDRSIMLDKRHGLNSIVQYGGMLGASMVMYSNSRISRGIDVPFVDIMIANGCTFAQPYQNAVISEIKDRLMHIEFTGEGDAESVKREFYDAIAIRESLLTDEITNGVLRISPVIGKGEDQTKTIIVSGRDFEHINPEATSLMRVIEVNYETDLPLLASGILTLARRVSPERVNSVSAAWDAEHAVVWGLHPAAVGTTVSRAGCPVNRLDAVATTFGGDTLINKQGQKQREKSKEIEDKILSVFSNQSEPRMKVGTFKKWCNGKLTSYTAREVGKAVGVLIASGRLQTVAGKDGKSPRGRDYLFVLRPPKPGSK